MNLPTKLTFLMILLIPVFVAVFYVDFSYNRFVALGIFALACFTDFLDGYLARKNNQVTNLGKFLDPIADKMLVACALIAVVTVPITYSGGMMLAWVLPPSPAMPNLAQILMAVFAMIILCRELMVSCFRIVASSKNVILAADIWGKLKTIFQMVALIILVPVASIHKLSADVGVIFYAIGFIFLAVATIFTILSGINYVVKNKHVLKD